MPSALKISQRPIKWAEVQEIVAFNDLNIFARSQEATDKYIAFKRALKESGLTVFRHIVVNTLKWREADELEGVKDEDITVEASGAPLFANASDLKVVRNDFPYYFEEDVSHLCVWSKRRIEPDPESKLGDISDETRALIESYVHRTFVEWLGVPRENLVWFRNWEALQSVKEISHVHVVVKGMTSEQLARVVGGPGMPLSQLE